MRQLRGIDITDREALRRLDDADPLAPLRDLFHIPEGIVYLDGNSLGPLPRSVVPRLQRVVEGEWGETLIRGWTEAGWMVLTHRVGAAIAQLIGADGGSVVVADSTSVVLFKLMVGALRARPQRRVLLTEEENFPTDLYIAATAAEVSGADVVRVRRERLLDSLDGDVALLALTHVDYRTGLMHDMAALTAAAHQHGALVLWDLSHSAGAVPVDLRGCDADLAAGCGYKYLNGGPGAPAFLHVNPRLHDVIRNPITGWMGHADPFSFSMDFAGASGIGSQLTGTPPVLALAVLEEAVRVFERASMEQLREKSLQLTDLFIALVESRCGGSGLVLATPREHERRGSQVSWHHPEGYGIVRALIDRGVIGDFRSPDVCRFGFAPLYLRRVDVYDAVEALAEVLRTEAHRAVS